MKGTYYNSKRSMDKKKAKMDIEGRIDWLVTHIYSAIGLSLYDKYGWDADQIQELFADSQELWQSSTREGWDILKNAEEIIGVEIKRFKDAGNIV